MLTDILNRSWKVSPEQASVLVKDVLSRRKVLYQGAMVSAGLMLAACAGIDFSTIGPAVAGDLADIAAALSTGLGALGSLSGQLPAGWAATLQQIEREARALDQQRRAVVVQVALERGEFRTVVDRFDAQRRGNRVHRLTIH